MFRRSDAVLIDSRYCLKPIPLQVERKLSRYFGGSQCSRSRVQGHSDLLDLAEAFTLHVLIGGAEQLVGSFGRVFTDGKTDAALHGEG